MTQQIAMLSARDATFDDIRFPAYVSTKFDGIRCLTKSGKGYSRQNIELPNQMLQSRLAALPTILDKLDGELVVGEPTAEDCYNTSQSIIMSEFRDAPFTYYVFDDLREPGFPFEERQKMLQQRFMSGQLPSWCVLVQQRLITSKDELVRLYEWLVEQGHEGVITRNPLSPYKCGRGTIKAQDMIKLKPREDSEAEIIGMEELQHNGNVAFIGEVGQTKRSSHKANKFGGNTLGKLVLRDIYSGEVFKCGTFKGFKKPQLKEMWDNREKYMHTVGVYSFCPVGVKKLPRQPSWKGQRSAIDIAA